LYRLVELAVITHEHLLLFHRMLKLLWIIFDSTALRLTIKSDSAAAFSPCSSMT
jgi:hypothetical protein